jgi:cAMP-dependent protein kinase regulator
MIESNTEYLETKLKQIIDPLFFNLLTHRPKDVISFSLEWLTKQGGYTANGLTIGEKLELTGLRKEVKNLREIRDFHQDGESCESQESDTDDDDNVSEKDDELNEEKLRRKRDTVIARGPRIAVSAETYGNFNQNSNYKPIVHPKSEAQVSSIKARIINSFLFNSLDSSELKIVIDAMEMKEFTKGELVIKQGEQGNCLFIVEKGELECFKTFQDGETRLVKQYYEGDVFGELSLLYNSPRAAEVVAVNDVILWKLDRYIFNLIVKDAAG